MENTSTSNIDQKTILLVDDDQLVIDVIGKILSARNQLISIAPS